MRFVLLSLLVCAMPTQAETTVAEVRAAVQKSLPRIEKGASNYITQRQCFSCHHQALPVFALSSARQRGFTIDEKLLARQVEFTVDTFKPKREQVAKGQGVPGASTMAAYALVTLEVAGHQADETTTSLVDYLLVKQRTDGSWNALAQRPPTEGSAFTNTALALRSLKAFVPAEDKDRVAKKEAAFARGKAWLIKNEPATTEDKVFHLRGLLTAEAEESAVARSRANLLKEQKDDGGWAQLPELASDAYATGTVLTALHASGLGVSDPAFQRGIRYLLKTQKDDGSWFVETRSRPVQTFFDNGDPGGKSQFISFAATNWAVLALLEMSLPAQPKDEPSGPKPINLEKLNTKADEDDPHLSSDGLHLFYASKVDDNWDLMHAARRTLSQPWGKGEPLSELNTPADDKSVSLFNIAGRYPHYLYFATKKDKDKSANFDIYVAVKQSARADFSAPTPVNSVCTEADEMHPWITGNGRDLYFSRKTKEGWRLLVASRTQVTGAAGFGEPKLLDLPADFHHATLTPDGNTMYLQGPLEGKRWGLFRSVRVNGSLSKPEPIEDLNSLEAPTGDRSPCLSRDGATLYFVSDRLGGKGGLDLWMVPVGQLGKKK